MTTLKFDRVDETFRKLIIDDLDLHTNEVLVHEGIDPVGLGLIYDISGF